MYVTILNIAIILYTCYSVYVFRKTAICYKIVQQSEPAGSYGQGCPLPELIAARVPIVKFIQCSRPIKRQWPDCPPPPLLGTTNVLNTVALNMQASRSRTNEKFYRYG